MLKVRRRRAADRLTWTETVTIDETSTAVDQAAFVARMGAGFGGFEGALREIESQIQRLAPPSGVDPAERSLAWYAREILRWIPRARSAAAAHAVEPAAIAALRIGCLYGELRIRHAFGPAAEYVRGVKANRVKAGRRRGHDVHADAVKRDEDVKALAYRLRQKHPYDREHSTRWLAREITLGLEVNKHTIRARLAALRLR